MINAPAAGELVIAGSGPGAGHDTAAQLQSARRPRPRGSGQAVACCDTLQKLHIRTPGTCKYCVMRKLLFCAIYGAHFYQSAT